jgi:hypothetical protein
MVRILDRNVKVWHLLVLGLLLGVLVGSTITIAATPAAQWGSGNIRLASAASASTVSISGTDTPPVRVLRTEINVPSGRVADIQASFGASLLPNKLTGTFAYCFGYFTLDSQTNTDPQFRPGQVQLIGGPHADQPNAVGVGMEGWRRNIGPGRHHVNVYINSAFAGCTLMERALNVVMNVR